MLARCARCQGTFQAERFGVQTCPHCGGEVHLADPAASPSGEGAAPSPRPPPPPPPPSAGPFSPPTSGAGLPPPPPPPPGGYGPPPGGFGGGPRGPGGQAPGAGELPAPFAERAKLGFLRSFFATWKLAATEPGNFFGRVRIDQTGAAILFGVLSFTIGRVVEAFWTSMTAASLRAQVREFTDRFLHGNEELTAKVIKAVDEMTSASAIMNQAVWAPLFGIVVLFVGSAVVHSLLLLVRGAGRGFNATLTVLGYTMGISLLMVIPQCGFPVAVIWAAVVAIIGLSEVHRTGVGRSAAAILLPILLVCACFCAAVAAAVGAAGLGGMTGGGPKAF